MFCPWFGSFSFIMLYVLLLAVGVAVASPSGLAVNRTGRRSSDSATRELVCPRTGDLWPCSCSPLVGDTVSITCYGLTPQTNLRNISQLISGFQISSFSIGDSPLDNLPAHLLLPLKINQLSLSNVNSTRLSFLNDVSQSPSSPQIFGHLYSLSIRKASGIDTWDWSVFQRFQIFDVVHVRESSFPRLTKSFGSLPNTIKEIRFVDIPDMESVAHGALSRLENLETLQISKTPLRVFERHVLPRPSLRLMVLDLSDNQLSSLSYDMFAEMPLLTILSLERNKLASIASPTFIPTINITPSFRVFLKGNPLNCDCNLAWLNVLYQTHRKILGEEPQAKCSAPGDLGTVFIHALQKEDFQCGKNYDLLPDLSDADFNLLGSMAEPPPTEAS